MQLVNFAERSIFVIQLIPLNNILFPSQNNTNLMENKNNQIKIKLRYENVYVICLDELVTTLNRQYLIHQSHSR